MKFYYLPYPMGFVSISKNHFIIYNEKQQAKYKGKEYDVDMVNNFKDFWSKLESINHSIDMYDSIKDKPFDPRNIDWIIT